MSRITKRMRRLLRKISRQRRKQGTASKRTAASKRTPESERFPFDLRDPWWPIHDPGALSPAERTIFCETLIGEGRFGTAEAMLTNRLDENPRHAPSLYMLGITLLLQDRIDEALPMIEAAYALKGWLREFRPEVYDIKPAVEGALRARPDWAWARYELQRHAFTGVGMTFDNAVRHSLAHQDVFFVEIGANDGRRGDKVLPNARRYGWSGLLVEPQPQAFESLQATYAGNDNVILANVAIGERDEHKILYFEPQGRLTLSSFVPERNLLSRAKHLEQVEVECLTFASLFDRYHVEQVDLLQIDTEGYDYKVLKGFDFSRYRPKLINMEFFCLPIAERLATVELLREAGYAWRFHRMDLVALDLNVFERDLHIFDRRGSTALRGERRETATR